MDGGHSGTHPGIARPKGDFNSPLAPTGSRACEVNLHGNVGGKFLDAHLVILDGGMHTNQLAHLVLLVRIKPIRGLVQHQHVRVVNDGLRETRAVAVAF